MGTWFGGFLGALPTNKDPHYLAIKKKLADNPNRKLKINLLYYDAARNEKNMRNTAGNFGDEINKFLIQKLTNQEKFQISYNQHWNKHARIDFNLTMIGSYINGALQNTVVCGTGSIDTKLFFNHPSLKRGHNKNLYVIGLRGPKTQKLVQENRFFKKNFESTWAGASNFQFLGDPALALKVLYQPQQLPENQDKICILPHYVHHKYFDKVKKWKKLLPEKYNEWPDSQILDKFKILDATWFWEDVVNQIFSCRAVISSSLHGLIISDTYDVPNIWLKQWKLRSHSRDDEDFKFYDYFDSQGRPHVGLTNLKDFDENDLYTGGNKVNVQNIIDNYPFS